MFYFSEFNNNKILTSDYLDELSAGFTLRGETSAIFNSDNFRSIHPEQTHSSNVSFVKDKDFYPETDGLITDKQNVLLYLKFADCTPLIFYNPKTKMIAISHAGWRGTAAKIGVKTLEKFNCNPKDIRAVIGPAIGRCCYEVSEEVRDELLKTVVDKTDLASGRNVDLKLINARQLEESGVEKIDICPYCTSCNNDLFYSYRKENGTDKRHYAFAMLHT